MQENLKKYMGNSENPKGTNIINNLTSTKYFLIAMAIKKYLCLASYSLYLFLERNELIEVPLNSRYPLEVGLLPDGKPTIKQAKQFYEFAKNIFEKINSFLQKSE